MKIPGLSRQAGLSIRAAGLGRFSILIKTPGCFTFVLSGSRYLNNGCRLKQRF